MKEAEKEREREREREIFIFIFLSVFFGARYIVYSNVLGDLKW